MFYSDLFCKYDTVSSSTKESFKSSYWTNSSGKNYIIINAITDGIKSKRC